MDVLRINGIRAYGYTGFFPEEKKLGQWFQVDLLLETDLQTAAATDALEETINYAHVIQMTQSIIASEQFDLIEALAACILHQLLQMPRIQTAQIQLTKETPPIPDFSGTVTVQMKRSRIEP